MSKYRNIVSLGIVSAILMILTVGATSYAVGQSRNGAFEFRMSEVTAYDDDHIVRVGGELIGMPHTSNRIDCILLVNGCDTIAANDIDGVDFKRYFQWEEGGVIDIEFDFPAVGQRMPAVGAGSQILFQTILGTYTHQCR